MCRYFYDKFSSDSCYNHIFDAPSYASIKPILIKIKNKDYNSFEIIQILNKFNRISAQKQIKQIDFQKYSLNETVRSYNKFNKQGDIDRSIYKTNVLLDQYQNLIPKVFSELASIVLEMEKEKPKILLLYTGINRQINLKRNQILYLLASMALNIIPKQDYHEDSQKRDNFNRINNFSYIFSSERYKTKCIMEYFIKVFQKKKAFCQSQNFTLRRKVQKSSFSTLLKQKNKNQMSSFQICSNTSSIEEKKQSIKIDFANKYIGGGALTRGCVQEQIMFANHPEMFISTLLCQVMNGNQSILFIGFKKYFSNIGYGYQTKFAGEDNLEYGKDQKGRVKQYISAIDAIEFKNIPMSQFNQKYVQREILKAYTGFNAPESQTVVTGNWGCGVFKGNLSLKFMIQWIACSMAGKHMIYCPFGQRQHIYSYPSLIESLKSKTIGEVYNFVISSCNLVKYEKDNIFQYMKILKQNKKKTSFFNFFNKVQESQQDKKPLLSLEKEDKLKNKEIKRTGSWWSQQNWLNWLNPQSWWN